MRLFRILISTYEYDVATAIRYVDSQQHAGVDSHGRIAFRRHNYREICRGHVADFSRASADPCPIISGWCVRRGAAVVIDHKPCR